MATPLNIVITGADTELGQATVQQCVAQGHQVTGLALDPSKAAEIRAQGGRAPEVELTNVADLRNIIRTVQADVVLHLVPQLANTLLSDGQGWKEFDKIGSTTRALLEAVQETEIKLLVHTSYAFLYGNATAATESTPLTPPGDDPLFSAAIALEQEVIHSSVPHCVLRLGYLYGPQSQDLKSYILSFKLGRPYFAGPDDNRGNWLHFDDAAQALVKVVAHQPVGTVLNLVDGTPVSFADFVDSFAMTLGRDRPLHIPMWGTPLAKVLVVTQQQVELLKLTTQVSAAAAQQQLDWQPKYSSYQAGLQQTVQYWRAHNEINA